MDAAARGLPKISIVTPSFNQADYLEDTLRSVGGQRYPRLEHIVVDGGSSDGSVDIIRRYESHLAYWISEPDRGQVHAINKGIARSTGEVVAFLNSDDMYLPGSLMAVGEHFRTHPRCQWLCGNTLLFGHQGHATELVEAVVPRSAGQCLSWAYQAPQPGMFWRRHLVNDGFAEKWRYCFDHEFYMRLLLGGLRCEHLPLPLAAYRLHGQSKTVTEADGFDREFEAIAELYEPRLHWPARQRSTATRLLRRSYAASRLGRTREAAALVLRALLTHPPEITRRPFWGCLRGLTRGPIRSA
jgi:glycosyltransferase involved in cell wall biosynthesis